MAKDLLSVPFPCRKIPRAAVNLNIINLASGPKSPSFCSFCFSQSESVDHIFVDCWFAKALWSRLASAFLISLDLEGGFLHLCVQAMRLNFSPQMSDPETGYIECKIMEYHRLTAIALLMRNPMSNCSSELTQAY